MVDTKPYEYSGAPIVDADGTKYNIYLDTRAVVGQRDQVVGIYVCRVAPCYGGINVAVVPYDDRICCYDSDDDDG